MTIRGSLDRISLRFIVILKPLDPLEDLPDLETDLGTSQASKVQAAFAAGIGPSVRWGRKILTASTALVVPYLALIASQALDRSTPLWLDAGVTLLTLVAVVIVPIRIIYLVMRGRGAPGALGHIHALDGVLIAWRAMRDCRHACIATADERIQRKARKRALSKLQFAANQVRIRYPKLGNRLGSYGAHHVARQRSETAARAVLSFVVPLIDGDDAEMLVAQQSLAQMASAVAAKDWDALPAVGLTQDVPLGWTSEVNWAEVRGIVLTIVSLVLAWLAVPK